MADQYDPYQYLLTFDGNAQGFLAAKKAGQRIGQAFVNNANENDRWILQHTDSRLFYSDSREDVRKAVQGLLEFGS